MGEDRDDDASVAVLADRMRRLDRDVQKLSAELDSKYVLVIRFVPIERGFYWLTGSIVGAVILAVLALVLKR